VLAHPPPVTDHASIFHHARQAAPDEDRHGPGSTTAQTPRRNLAVDGLPLVARPPAASR
jgi:hypothetical protein